MASHIGDLYRTLEGPKPIRLLRILPGDTFDSIAVDLIHDHLANAKGSYEALSYTWGDPKAKRSITCNGQRFGIGQNAHAFLARLRDPVAVRLVWMDCICINQDDLSERSEQVKFMHELYRDARRTVVWLGEEADDSQLAIEFALRIDTRKCLDEALRHYVYDSLRFTTENKSSIFDIMCNITDTQENLRLIKALVALIHRPWLRRVWIQQEAAMSLDIAILCGSDQTTWDQLFSLTWLMTPRTSLEWPEWVEYDPNTLTASLRAAYNIQKSRWSQQRKYPDPWQGQISHNSVLRNLLSLAISTTWCESTDPRDKLYALFNMVVDRQFQNNALTKFPPIDYSSSWQEVYIRAAQFMYGWSANFTPGTSPIDEAGRANQLAADLPSWVPDWRCANHNDFVHHNNWDAGGSMGRGQPHFVQLSGKGRRSDSIPVYHRDDTKRGRKRIPNVGLELPCILLDKIVYRGGYFDHVEVKNVSMQEARRSIIEDPQMIERIKNIWQADLQYVEKQASRYMTGELTAEAYAGTIIANTTHTDTQACKQFEHGFVDARAWLNAGELSEPHPEYFEAVLASSVYWSTPFGVTSHGLMFLAPAIAKVGDYIAVLSGHKYPVALRRVGASESQYYVLLGACYVHRLMRGRATSLVEDFACKYHPGSEDREKDDTPDSSRTSPSLEGNYEFLFPFNNKKDYRHVLEVLGKRKIVLV